MHEPEIARARWPWQSVSLCMETFAEQQDVSIRFISIYVIGNDSIPVGVLGGRQAELYRLMVLYSCDR